MKNIIIQTNNMEITEAISSYTEEKLSHLDKFFKEGDEVKYEVRLGKETDHHKKGDLYNAEVSIKTPHKNYGADSTKDNLYSAIDDVKDQLAKKITHYKDKRESLFKRGAAQIKNLFKGQ